MISTLRPINLSQTLGLLACVLVALVCVACAVSEESRIKKLCPGLSDEAVHQLVASDDSTLAQWAQDVGMAALLEGFRELLDGFKHDSIKSYERSYAVLLPPMKRLAGVMESVFAYYRVTLKVSVLETLPMAVQHESGLLLEKLGSTIHNISLEPDEKIEILLKIAHRYEEIGNLSGAAICKSEIARFYSNLGDDQAKIRYMRDAISDCCEAGNYYLACQQLGALGHAYHEIGQVDSMKICYEKGLDLAKLHHLWRQLARLTRFYAAFYKQEGHLSVVHDLYDEAREIYQDYNLGYSEFYLIETEVSFYADLGAWDVVERLLQRVRVLVPEPSSKMDNLAEIRKLTQLQMEARYLMAIGKVNAAEDIYERIRIPVKNLTTARLYYPQMLYQWAQGLIKNQQADRAIPLIQEGIKRSESDNLPELHAPFALIHALVLFELGDIKGAKRALDQFDNKARSGYNDLRQEHVDADVLRVEIALVEGNKIGAVSEMERALTRLVEVTSELDAGVHGYLWLSRCETMRQLLHDLVADDPELGYGAEFLWKSMYRTLGARSRAAAIIDPEGEHLFDRLRGYAQAARACMANYGAVHCAYLARQGEVWRWTSSPTGIRREVLKSPADDLRRLVSKTVKEMSSDPGDRTAVPSRELVDDLRELAIILLPPEVLNNNGTRSNRPFFVSTDGFLCHLPFETLDIHTGEGYRPLLANFDVAYVRHAVGSPPGRTMGAGVILANDQVTERQRLRYSTPDLRGVLHEGKAAEAMNPGATFLHGARATKDNLTNSWEDAAFIYMAAHVIRDPQIPYLILFPLAVSGRNPDAGAAYLDVGDIRAADLSQCRLVVLSGCSTGAANVSTATSAPGFCDAFLDAGAGIVVYTNWDVLDEEAKKIMSSFIREWGELDFSMIKSLCNTKRAAMNGPNGIRHPFIWAAYSVKIGRL